MLSTRSLRWQTLSVVNGFKRGYSKEVIHGIEWYKPKPVSFADVRRTGDGGIEHGVKDTDFLPFYATSPELEGANDMIKAMFTVGYNRRREKIKLRGEKLMGLVKRHVLDRGSTEVKIAALTNEIHNLQEVYKEHPKHKVVKSFLKEMIDKRAKLLKKLRVQDYKRFEWVLERLNLIYKAPLTVPKISGRKDAFRRLTDEFCENLKNERLEKYREELENEKHKFYKRKVETLQWIQQEEKKYNISPSVTQEEVEKAIQQYHEEEQKYNDRMASALVKNII